ncbi:lipoate--protein ligase family protein [Erwinia sp. CPCC 100877]|nr:lipoate--protein ligase family protein [Erwinia sp. CPCC 100877]
MKNEFEEYFKEATVAVYDQHCLTAKDYFLPFALTDIFTAYSGTHRQPIIHFWQLDHAMILGMKDTRITDLTGGLASLKEDGYAVVVRNSGGLGVISDEGVLNVSLIIPNPPNKKMSIDQAYTLMWHWLKAAFETDKKQIEAFEIADSYCPGTFDLSIDGKKFAGIAQRRIKDGTAVMIYLSVNGDQKKRGQSVKNFYKSGLHEEFGQNGYPAVNPNVMANLAELIDQSLTISMVKQRLLEVLTKAAVVLDQNGFTQQLTDGSFTDEIAKQLEKMTQRNELLKDYR